LNITPAEVLTIKGRVQTKEEKTLVDQIELTIWQQKFDSRSVYILQTD